MNSNRKLSLDRNSRKNLFDVHLFSCSGF